MMKVKSRKATERSCIGIAANVERGRLHVREMVENKLRGQTMQCF